MKALLGLTVAILSMAGAVHGATTAGYSQTMKACLDKAVTTFDMQGCNAAELKARNTELNGAYGKALSRVGDAASAFRAGERAWIAYRDADCAVYQNRMQFGTLGSVQEGDCLIQRTIERTRALEAFATD